MYNFCLDACLYLQRMEQYCHERRAAGHDPFKDQLSKDKDVQPAIVVHCKAGKGRTGTISEVHLTGTLLQQLLV